MEISRHWRLQKTRYGTARGGLIGERCSTEHFIFPPRDICPNCVKTNKGQPPDLYEFSGKGEVYSYTTVYEAPAGFEEMAPYTIALIALEEGPLITAQLTDVDNDKVKIGMPVEMVTRKLSQDGPRGQIVYGYKFRPPIIPKIT